MRLLFGILSIWTLQASAAYGAEELTARYLSTWTGLEIFEIDLTVIRDDDHYKLSAETGTKGLLSWLYKVENEISAEGMLVDGAPRPSRFRTVGDFDGAHYERHLAFDISGKLAELTQQIPEKWQSKYPRKPVPENQQKGPDPFSLLMLLFDGDMISKAQAARADAPLSLKTFDGGRVYTVDIVCDADFMDMKASFGSRYTGPARRCTVGFTLLAGGLDLTDDEKAALRAEDERDSKRLERLKRRRAGRSQAREDNPDQIEIYVADIDGSGLLLPVGGLLPSDLGAIRLNLDSFDRKPAADIQVAAYSQTVIGDVGQESCPLPESTGVLIADKGPSVATDAALC